ncbi:MAG TPA: carboxypeptidase-like regulatory domain-containing protein [Candidatus Saccharimonadales bacterium]|nr:carboxypeptidase-like regulatory domain-containing protein [Candidatus Saccharimonadales bacterium]
MESENEAKRLSLSKLKIHKNKIIIIVVVIAAILIIGFLFSGGTIPNSNLQAGFKPAPAYKTSLGAINGYVYGPLGLPAVGATVIAAEQGGTATSKTAFISIDGKYVFSELPPGEYILMVAFPDGANKVLDEVQVTARSVQTINFNY